MVICLLPPLCEPWSHPVAASSSATALFCSLTPQTPTPTNSPFLGASPRRAADGPRRMPRDPPARGQLPAQLQADQLQYPRHGGCGCGCSFNQCETRRSIKKNSNRQLLPVDPCKTAASQFSRAHIPLTAVTRALARPQVRVETLPGSTLSRVNAVGASGCECRSRNPAAATATGNFFFLFIIFLLTKNNNNNNIAIK